MFHVETFRFLSRWNEAINNPVLSSLVVFVIFLVIQREVRSHNQGPDYGSWWGLIFGKFINVEIIKTWQFFFWGCNESSQQTDSIRSFNFAIVIKLILVLIPQKDLWEKSTQITSKYMTQNKTNINSVVLHV